MAVYCRVYGFDHLRADCRGPGSAPDPHARIEYRIVFIFHNVNSTHVSAHVCDSLALAEMFVFSKHSW